MTQLHNGNTAQHITAQLLGAIAVQLCTASTTQELKENTVQLADVCHDSMVRRRYGSTE